MNVERLSAPVTTDDRAALIVLLIACVEAGASIGFLAPLSAKEVESYWNRVFVELAGGHRVLLVSRQAESGRIIASAQLALETRANGRHRAEVQKVMVLPGARRQGLAARLMREIEAAAGERGVRLLCLDTSDGRGGARAFYDALRYTYVGGIPGYALEPDGIPAQNAIYYKTLAPGG